MMRPLDGIRVIEIGRSEAAGVAGLLLSDFGAEVILIDPPGECGDLSAACHEDSITFGVDIPAERLCDRGKKRVFLDIFDEDQKALFQKLLGTADVLLIGTAPQLLREAGLDEDTLSRLYPELASVTVSAYGTTGPYAERPWSEACVQAESGFVSTTGPEDGDPVRSGGDMANFLGGLITCAAALMELAEKERRRAVGDNIKGRHADVSMMDSIVFGLENQFSLYLKSGKVPVPKGNHYALSAPVGNFPCRDGEIMISVATEAQWKAFSEAIGHPEWVDRPEFFNVSRRLENYKLLGETVTEAFMQYDRKELMEILQSRSCIYGCINDFPGVTEHVQTRARHMFMEVISGDGSKYIAPANPILIDGGHMQSEKISLPGAQTKEILEALPL